MRPRPLATILLLLSCTAGACKLFWSYDDFKDQPPPGTGGSGTGDGGTMDAGSDAPPPKTPDGLPCEAGVDCQSGTCEPGLGGGDVCCAVACGTCLTCDGDGGACAPIPAGTQGPGCAGGLVCDGAGGCKVNDGSACPGPGGAACLSGVCMNGICCAMACPACQSCKGDGSGCTPNPACSTDTRCTTQFMVCDGNGNCI